MVFLISLADKNLLKVFAFRLAYPPMAAITVTLTRTFEQWTPRSMKPCLVVADKICSSSYALWPVHTPVYHHYSIHVTMDCSMSILWMSRYLWSSWLFQMHCTLTLLQLLAILQECMRCTMNTSKPGWWATYKIFFMTHNSTHVACMRPVWSYTSKHGISDLHGWWVDYCSKCISHFHSDPYTL